MLPLYGMGDSGTCEDGKCTSCGMPSGEMGIGAPQLARMPPTDPAISLPSSGSISLQLNQRCLHLLLLLHELVESVGNVLLRVVNL